MVIWAIISIIQTTNYLAFTMPKKKKKKLSLQDYFLEESMKLRRQAVLLIVNRNKWWTLIEKPDDIINLASIPNTVGNLIYLNYKSVQLEVPYIKDNQLN